MKNMSNKAAKKNRIKQFSEYLMTAFVFYSGMIFLGVIPIHLIVTVLIISCLAYLIFQTNLLGVILLICLITNFVYISFQRLVLLNKICLRKKSTFIKSSEQSSMFKLRILDLDGSIIKQKKQLSKYNFEIIALQDWGTKIRFLCSFSTFKKFEIELGRRLNKTLDKFPYITFLGSNDFDHVTLTLLRQIPTSFNLLFLDKHADWNPFFLTDMMCGSWLYHAFSATNMRMVFHVGGDEKAFDATGNIFDAAECFGNGRGIQKYIDEGRIVCLPATREFAENSYVNYEHTVNQPVKISSKVFRDRLKSLIGKHKEHLESIPLFIAIDKDVFISQDNIQSWESGELSLEDVETIISTFIELCNNRIVGVSICGDYSKSNYNTFLHFGSILEKLAVAHGVRIKVDTSSLNVNEKTNERLLLLFLNNFCCQKFVEEQSSI